MKLCRAVRNHISVFCAWPWSQVSVAMMAADTAAQPHAGRLVLVTSDAVGEQHNAGAPISPCQMHMRIQLSAVLTAPDHRLRCCPRALRLSIANAPASSCITPDIGSHTNAPLSTLDAFISPRATETHPCQQRHIHTALSLKHSMQIQTMSTLVALIQSHSSASQPLNSSKGNLFAAL